MNAKAENGSSSVHFLINSSSVSGLMPLTWPTSLGLGKKSTTASKINWTPLFLKAAPQIIGTKAKEIVPFLMQAFNSASDGSLPLR